MNLHAVAERAKVSTATVSRVLNNVGTVKSSTRARVMKAVQELRYYPNLHARTLAGGRSSTIGMIVSNMENPFFFDVFRATELRVRNYGYDLVVAHTGYDADQLVQSIHLMLGRRVAGLAVIVSEMDPGLIQELCSLKIPVVFYDVGTPTKNISNIRVDYGRGVEKAVCYLHSVGHRSMAYVGHHSGLAPTSAREKAFRATVARLSPQVKSAVVAGGDSLDGGRTATREVFASGFRPTAFVCVNDFVALGVMRELRERGLRIPQDCSVTGFDNIKLSEYASPPLTTLHIPRDTIGDLVCQALCAPGDQNGPAAGHETVIEAEMVLRESTGPVSLPTASAGIAPGPPSRRG